MTEKPIPIGEIKKLAADIRLIKDFAENHNFDASLIIASIEPKSGKPLPRDWPLILASVFTLLVVGAIASLNFLEGISPTASKFIFVLGLLLAGLASICLHRRFENTTITVISGAVLVVVLLVGGGIFTPKEAVGELQKLRQK